MFRFGAEWGLDLLGASVGWLLIGLVLLFAKCVQGAELGEAVGITVLDADTVRVETLHLGWGVSLNSVTVRAADFDAWEASKRRRSVKVTDAEVAKGKLATTEFREWIEGKTLIMRPIARPRDRYGRLLATWSVDGQEVAVWMKEQGHVRH